VKIAVCFAFAMCSFRRASDPLNEILWALEGRRQIVE
jgi:hypothetical protein